jgi:predicted CoA-binding protein
MPVIAVIGASASRGKFGNKALRAYRARGYTVVPVNLHEAAIEGERVYASVLDYPGEIDEATMYVPPEAALRVLEDLARKSVKTVWLNPGADDPAVVTRARALGLEPIVACSILGVGERPGDY